MPPKKLPNKQGGQAAPKPSQKKQPGQQSNDNRQAAGVSDKERNAESAKAAQRSVELQNKARELSQAAAGAGDPEERQKLLNEALNKQVEAESFGKWAKYLQSGSFQGLAAGAGIGSVPGLTLGTLTGTLVGGLTTLITGGLGGAVGYGVGALHGPWFKVGDVAGSAIRKVTGDLPGWVASDEQKKSLEKMLGQVKDTETPTEDELKALTGKDAAGGGGTSGGSGGQGGGGQSWTEYAASYLPSSGGGSGNSGASQQQSKSWTESASGYMPSLGSKDEKQQGGNGKGASESEAAKATGPTAGDGGQAQKQASSQSTKAPQTAKASLDHVSPGGGESASKAGSRAGGEWKGEHKKPAKLERRNLPASSQPSQGKRPSRPSSQGSGSSKEGAYSAAKESTAVQSSKTGEAGQTRCIPANTQTNQQSPQHVSNKGQGKPAKIERRQPRKLEQRKTASAAS